VRDDLHRTVSLTPPWRRVLRCFSRDRGSAQEISVLIANAVWQESSRHDTVNGLRISDVLDVSTYDFWGGDKMYRSLLKMQEGPISVQGRAVCEVAMGMLAEQQPTPFFRNQVLHAAGAEYAKDRIEHIASSVAKAVNYQTGTEVRRALTQAAKLCDFSAEAKPTRRRKLSTDQLLSSSLELVVF